MTQPQPDDESEDARCERHRRAERRHWTFEKIFGRAALLLTAIAAGGAIVAAVFTAKQSFIMDDTEKRQLRAYVIVKSAWFEKEESGKIKLVDTNSAGNSVLLIHYEISNEGVTPAYEVARKVTVDYPFRRNITFDYSESTAAYIGKQQAFGPIATRHFTPDEIKGIMLGEKDPLVFAGQITYRDIFGRTWTTNFCFWYTKIWSGDIRFNFCPRWSDKDRLNYAE